jgi:hypothetical protein
MVVERPVQPQLMDLSTDGEAYVKISLHKMLRYGVVAVALGGLIGSSPTAEAGTVVVDFDDLTGSGSVADGYGGINWGGEWEYYDSNDPPYTPASFPTRVYGVDANGDYNPAASFTFSTSVEFQGAYFAGYDTPVNFELYLNGTLVHTSASIVPSSTPAFLASGYSGPVDMVTVITNAGANTVLYVMDDVTYNTLSSVPEPSSVVMLGMGGLGLALGAVSRRQGGRIASA